MHPSEQDKRCVARKFYVPWNADLNRSHYLIISIVQSRTSRGKNHPGSLDCRKASHNIISGLVHRTRLAYFGKSGTSPCFSTLLRLSESINLPYPRRPCKKQITLIARVRSLTIFHKDPEIGPEPVVWVRFTTLQCERVSPSGIQKALIRRE